MNRFWAGFKMFCAVFFGITGVLVAFFGTLYLFMTWFGEGIGAWAMILLIIFFVACGLGYLEYKAPWNN